MPNYRIYNWFMDRTGIVVKTTSHFSKKLLTNATKFAIIEHGGDASMGKSQ